MLTLIPAADFQVLNLHTRPLGTLRHGPAVRTSMKTYLSRSFQSNVLAKIAFQSRNNIVPWLVQVSTRAIQGSKPLMQQFMSWRRSLVNTASPTNVRKIYASIILNEVFQAHYSMRTTAKRSPGATALNPSSDSAPVIQCKLAHVANTRATSIRVSASLDMALYLLTSHSEKNG